MEVADWPRRPRAAADEVADPVGGRCGGAQRARETQARDSAHLRTPMLRCTDLNLDVVGSYGLNVSACVCVCVCVIA